MAPSRLPPQLLERFEALRRRLAAGMDGTLGSIAALDLSVVQAMALFRLRERGPLTIGELQTLVGRAQGTTSHLVEQLEQRELVLRRTDEHDRRRRVVALTRRGEAAVAEIESLRQTALRDVLRRIPPATLERLDLALQETLTALSELPKKPSKGERR